MINSFRNPSEAISHDVECELPWLTQELGFKKVEDVAGESFGNSYATYAGRSVRVTFGYDRGETIVWVGPASKPNYRHNLEFVRDFLSGKRGPGASTLLEYGVLLREHLPAIEQAFGSDFPRIQPEIDSFAKKYERENYERVIAEGRAQRAADMGHSQ